MSENNMSKKLKKGFTLIELIVVMAIMGFLFVAILNLLDPIQNVYKTAVGTQDTAETIEGVMTYADSQIKFASNVCVLKDFEGVPRVEGRKLFVNGIPQSTEYDNVLILDNNNDRSKSSVEVAKRKGATGAVLKQKITAGIDFDAATLAPANNYYGELRYEFDTEVNFNDAEKSKVYVDLGITAYSYHLENTTYVFDQKMQSYARRIELVNIGLSTGDTYKLDDYAIGHDSQMVAGNIYDTTGADKATRTYIFYKNPTITDSTKKDCDVNLQYFGTSNTYDLNAGFKVKIGSKASNVVEPTLKSVVVGTKIYTPTVPSEWTIVGDTSGTTYKISDIKNYVVTEDITFQAKYIEATVRNVHVTGPGGSGGTLPTSNGSPISFNSDTYKDLTGYEVPEDQYVSDWICTYSDGTVLHKVDNPTVTDELVSIDVITSPKLTGTFELTKPDGDVKTKTVRFIPGSPTTPEDDSEFTTSVDGYLFTGWMVGSDTYEEWASAHGDVDFTAKGSFVKDSADTTVKMVVHVSEESKGYSGRIIANSTGNNVTAIKVNGSEVWNAANSTYAEAQNVQLSEDTVTIEVVKPNNKQPIEVKYVDNANKECMKVEPTNIDGTTIEKWLYNNTFYETEADMLAFKNATPSIAFNQETADVSDGEKSKFIHYTVENNGIKSFKPYFRFTFADDVENSRNGWKVSDKTVNGKEVTFNLPDIAPGTVLNNFDETFVGVKSKNNPNDPYSITLTHVYIYYLDVDGNEVSIFDQDV